MKRDAYFNLTPNVKELRLRTTQAVEVELVVRNQDHLQIGLWVSTEQPIDPDVEFKNGRGNPPKP